MKRFLMKSLLVTVLLIGGCAGHQGVVLRDGNAYVLLKGDCAGVSLQIDENALIRVVGECNDIKYSVMPGRHVVKLYRDGKMILERLVFLGSNETCEVTIP